MTAHRFPYVQVDPALGAASALPYVPITLTHGQQEITASEARALLLTGKVREFAPVRLAFGWTRSNNVPVILGQVNFFMEFDICFYRSRLLFEIRVKETAED